jgi:hypothetical protein
VRFLLGQAIRSEGVSVATGAGKVRVDVAVGDVVLL